ncbi:hypothetical protein L6Q79_11110 [bacterium]|nr:hypothetical protein [bacterium]NUN46233.1 hypothetical protein [bacterium]
MPLSPKTDRIISSVLFLGLCVLSFWMIGWFQPNHDYKAKAVIYKPSIFVYEALQDSSRLKSWWTDWAGSDPINDSAHVMREIIDEEKSEFVLTDRIAWPGILLTYGYEDAEKKGSLEYRLEYMGDSTRVTLRHRTRGYTWIQRSLLALRYTDDKLRWRRYLYNFKRMMENDSI